MQATTSTARSLLRGLRAQGFTLRTDGEALIVSPRKRLSPIQVDAIKGAKKELMELVAWEEEEGPATTASMLGWFRSLETTREASHLFLLQGQQQNA